MIQRSELSRMEQVRPVFPRQVCMWTEDSQVRTTEHGPIVRLVQTISMPFPEKYMDGDEVKMFICRAVPGDATITMHIPEKELVLVPWLNKKRIYCHYAEVTARAPFSFPTDMLRCDDCQLSVHRITVEGDESLPWNDPRSRPPRARVGETFEVVQVTTRSKPLWNPARWESFSYEIRPKRTIAVIDGEWTPPK
jgi:hypothetical protein